MPLNKPSVRVDAVTIPSTVAALGSPAVGRMPVDCSRPKRAQAKINNTVVKTKGAVSAKKLPLL